MFVHFSVSTFRSDEILGALVPPSLPADLYIPFSLQKDFRLCWDQQLHSKPSPNFFFDLRMQTALRDPDKASPLAVFVSGSKQESARKGVDHETFEYRQNLFPLVRLTGRFKSLGRFWC